MYQYTLYPVYVCVCVCVRVRVCRRKGLQIGSKSEAYVPTSRYGRDFFWVWFVVLGVTELSRSLDQSMETLER